MIASAHSKSSNSSGFNPTLQKFYKIICDIFVSKTVSAIFLIFFRSSFINNFMVKNSFSEPKNQRKSNIWRPIYFEDISAHRFVGPICTNKLEGFFLRNEGLGAFFPTAARLIWASFFSTKNIFFFQGWLFNLTFLDNLKTITQEGNL